MNAQELYELVKGHEDVYGPVMHYEPGADWWNDEWGDSIPDPLAEAALIGLFSVATGCGVSYNHPTDESANDGDEPRWFAFDHNGDVWCFAQPSRLEALVRAREAGKERGE